jgi:polar amino acid transport system substrate-binding protein
MRPNGMISRRSSAFLRTLPQALVVTLGFGGFLSALPAHADLLGNVKQRGELVVGTEARFPPFEFVKDGKIVGYSSDMMEHIMKELPNVKFKQLDLPWQGILPGLAAKRFDYVITSVTATKERYNAYHLSVPIADATVAALKRKGDASITKEADLAGKVAGSQTGSGQLQALEGVAARLKAAGTPVASVKTYVDFNEAYADLAAGRLAVVVNSLPNLLEAVRQRPDAFEVVPLTSVPKTYFSWAGRKDADSETLNAFFDDQIRRMHKDGTLSELQKKWFGGVMDTPADALPVPAE